MPPAKKGPKPLVMLTITYMASTVTVLRYFTGMVAAGRPDMVMFRFCQGLAEGRPVLVTGDGGAIARVTYVDDIARGTLLAQRPVGYDVFNDWAGTRSSPITSSSTCWRSAWAKKPRWSTSPCTRADVLENVADVSKARRVLGWQPQVSLEEGRGPPGGVYLQERAWVKDVETP
jgi:nucleoside-diphosphate-sugar epimerase